MKALITGGAGFIGSHLADRLLARGDEVLVLDNYETGRRDNLSAHDHLTVIEGTITDADLVQRAMRDFVPDVVVHAAASYKDPGDWNGDILTNALGTAIVVRATEAAGCHRLVYFQTALCYGTHPAEQPVTLDHPLSPDSSYAISKTTGELYIRGSELNWISFRLANVYGPRNLSGPLPTFFARLDAGQPCFVMDTRRDFVYIDDILDCVVPGIDGEGAGVYHLSSGTDVAIKELFDETVAALGIHLEHPVEVRPRAPDDTYSILLDPSRARNDFGWRPVTGLKEGVARAIDYYRKFGIEQTFTHLTLPDRS